MTALASIDFPEPDSPTMPTVSPLATVRSTPVSMAAVWPLSGAMLDPQVVDLEQLRASGRRGHASRLVAALGSRHVLPSYHVAASPSHLNGARRPPPAVRTASRRSS